MSKNSSQRQANYRKCHLKEIDGDKRLDMVITLKAKSALERLVSCYRVTKKQLIEQLLLDKENEALHQADLINSEGKTDYYNKKIILEYQGEIVAKDHRKTTAYFPSKPSFWYD